MKIEQGALQLGWTAEQIIRRYGVALRFEEVAWAAAFQFGGPDVVAQGATPEAALANFRMQVAVENGDVAVTWQSEEQR